MEGKTNNIHAFPHRIVEVTESGVTSTEYCGMTLRDYFAAKAMQAALTGMYTRNNSMTPDLIYELIELAAKNSYYMADLMLEARNK